MFLTEMTEGAWDDKVVWQDGDFSLVRTVEAPMGRNPFITWEPQWQGTPLGFFKSKKLAMLGLQMILDGKIENTKGRGDLEAIMRRWYIDNDMYNEIPRGL